MKKGVMSGLISILICCSLIGVGFASWVITGGAEKESDLGSIHAEDITDNSITIDSMKFGDGAENDSIINFTIPASLPETKNKWLQNSSTTKEDLSAKLTVTISKYENLNGDKITATLAPADGDATKYNQAVAAGVIAEKPNIVCAGSKGSYTVTVTFKWGNTFGGANPYKFYNDMAPSDMVDDPYQGKGQITAKEHALKYMKYVYALNNVQYILTVNAESK